MPAATLAEGHRKIFKVPLGGGPVVVEHGSILKNYEDAYHPCHIHIRKTGENSRKQVPVSRFSCTVIGRIFVVKLTALCYLISLTDRLSIIRWPTLCYCVGFAHWQYNC